jgi:hypothetical protein
MRQRLWSIAGRAHGLLALAVLFAACANTVHGQTDFTQGLPDSSAPTDASGGLTDQGSTVLELDGAISFGQPEASSPSLDGGVPEAAEAAADVFTGPLAGPFQDFPATPILDTSDADAGAPPANAAQLFGSPDAGSASGGPCLIEPEVGALYPNNWLRPRFVWNTPNTQNLFELRLHVANQANDLLVYTAENGWTMPEAMWVALSSHSQDVPITVTVRGGLLTGTSTTLTNESTGSSGPIGIAPVSAPGTIVYWAINTLNNTADLKGFSVGDETVGTVLTPGQVQERTAANAPPCIGCHTATPDGLNVGFMLGYAEGAPGAYTDSIATLGVDAAPGLVPTFLTPDGKAAMDALGGIPAYSPAYWSASERLVLLSDVGSALNWVNLSGTGAAAKGVVARTGDTGLVTDPAWSNDGKTIVYTSASSVFNGRQANGPMVLYSVPYNDGMGGAATPIAGIAQSGMAQYYPAISPDDKYIVFNSAPSGDEPYSDGEDQIYFSPIGGVTGAGGPTRLNANDPPACLTGERSPGVTNSWAKWSPSAQYVSVLGNTYYWVVFSSTRYPIGSAAGAPQLYISGIVIDSKGNATTYASLYLWNQPATEHNHTPAWNYFQIPAAPPPPPNPPPIPPPPVPRPPPPR